MKKLTRKILATLYGYIRSAYYEHRYLEYRKKYKIHPDFGFNGTDIRFYGDGEIIIGSNCYIGTNSTIQSYSGQKVLIGNNTNLSHNVRLYTASVNPEIDFSKNNMESEIKGDIIIGNGVLIGANVFINPGITIGNNSIVGANSVVTKNIPDNCIVGGVPSKIIRYKLVTKSE